jgi:hypothetical protein
MGNIPGKYLKKLAIPFPLQILGVILLSIGFKVFILEANVVPFNADEAIVGLMAKHILEGKWPIFFYGQMYMGSLDAVLVALSSQFLGLQVFTIRIVQVSLYVGVVLTTLYLGKLLFKSNRMGLFAGLLMAIPTVNTTLYTTVSLGGYVEALLIGNLLLIGTLKIIGGGKESWYRYWGLLAGLGFWAFGLTLVYILPSLALIVYSEFKGRSNPSRWKHLLTLGLSFAIGASPWIAGAVQYGLGPLIRELLGAAIADASPRNLVFAFFSHTYNFLLFGFPVIFGMRAPWETRWLAQPLLPFGLGCWLLVIASGLYGLRKQDTYRKGRWLLGGVICVLVGGFLLTPFGADPTGRYFLPLSVPLSLFAAEFLENLRRQGGIAQKGAYGILLLILAFNLYGTLQAAFDSRTGLTTQFDPVTRIDHAFDQELIQFLEQQGERRGYSNYWVAYPLAFHSQERLIFVPRLPYHLDFRYTTRDDRYPPYDEKVTQSQKIAYITTNHPELDKHLREAFEIEGIGWREKTIGDYQIFYQLSEPVHPSELSVEIYHGEN